MDKTKGKNVAVWFEINAGDLDRASSFYETILDTKLKRETCGKNMAIFPYDPHHVSGCLIEEKGTRPAHGGVLVYLNCDGALNAVLGKVEKAGGKLLSSVIQLPEGMGSYAHIEDTEGNRIGLHAAF